MKVTNVLFEQSEAALLVKKQKVAQYMPKTCSRSHADLYQPLVTYPDTEELPSKLAQYPSAGFKVML